MPASDYLNILGITGAISAVILALLIGAVLYWRDKNLAIAVGVSVILAVLGSASMLVGHDITNANVTAAYITYLIIATVCWSAMLTCACLRGMCRHDKALAIATPVTVILAVLVCVVLMSVDVETGSLTLAIIMAVVFILLACAWTRGLYRRDKTQAIAIPVAVYLAVLTPVIMLVNDSTVTLALVIFGAVISALGCAFICFWYRHEIKIVVLAVLAILRRLTLTILTIFMLLIFAAWLYAVTSVDDEIKTLVLAIPVPVIIAVLSCAPLRREKTRAVFATFVTLILGTLVYVIVTSEGGDIKTQAIAILVAIISAVLARGCLGYVYQRYCPRARAAGAKNNSFWSLPPTFLKERTL